MPVHYPIQTNFTAGEIAPGLQSRMDQSKYANSCQILENWIVMPQGGVVRRPGIRRVYTAKQSDANIKLVEFSFSSNIEESYIIEFGCYDAGLQELSPYIRIYHPPTSTESHVVEILYDKRRYTWTDGAMPDTPDYVTDAPPWRNEDIPNLWCKQYGDILYIADGEHPVMKLTRSAFEDSEQVQPGLWDLKIAPFVGSAYKPIAKREVTFYSTLFYNRNEYQNALFGYNTSKDFGYNFQESYYKGNTSTSRYPFTFELDDPKYGILIAEPGSYEDHYNNYKDTINIIMKEYALYRGILNRTIEQNYVRTYSMKISALFWVPEPDEYYFSINCDTWGDLYVGEISDEMESVVSWFYQPHSANSIGPNEFKGKWGDSGGSGPQKKFLNRGMQRMIARAAFDPVFLNDSNWGIIVAWRRAGDLCKWVNGAWEIQSSPDFTITPVWYGNVIYDVILEAESGGTTFKWQWGRQTDVEKEASIYYNAAGTPDSWTTGIPFSTNGVNLSIQDPLENPWLAGEPGYNGIVATLVFNSTTYTPGTRWRFKVGFVPMPASQFRAQPQAGIMDEYPRVLDFCDQRMLLGGFPTPVIRLSRIGDFEDFSRGPNDDDGVELFIASGKFDPVVCCAMLRDLVVMSTSTVYQVGSDGATITPSDRFVRPVSDIGASFVMPAKAGNIALFADRTRKRIIAMQWNEWDTLVFPDISIWSYHLFNNYIKEIKYQPVGIMDKSLNPVSVAWIITDSGELRALTLEEQHKVYAFSRHASPGALFESIAVIPGKGKDTLWIAYKRGTERFIGYLDETIQADDCLTLTKTDVITGDNQWIWMPFNKNVYFVCEQFAEKRVAVYDGSGILLGTVLLSESGVGYLQADDEPSNISIGLIYESKLTPVPLAIDLGGMPTSIMKKRRARIWIQSLYNTGLTIDGEPVRDIDSPNDPVWEDVVLWGWDRDPVFDIVQSYPAPAQILAIADKVKINAP